MARRWTPRRFVTLRRLRVVVCVIAAAATCVTMFALSTGKAVALNVNGRTSTVRTHAMSVNRLLEEQGIDVKSHDLVTSSSGSILADQAVVTVRSAYQITVTVNGEEIPFWTVADSADQLIGFFTANESKAAKISVNIDNIYNQLTGGLTINKDGPVTVIADGKTSEAPNGKLPAASILDSKGINLGKEDRVSVEEEGGKTILRVRRVTHGQETRSTAVAFGTRTVVDSSLQPGETKIVQQGQNGERRQVYNVTYVDGVAESESLESEVTVQAPLDQVVAVGPEKTEQSDDTNDTNADTSNDDASQGNGQTGNSNGGNSSKADSGSTDTSNGGNASGGSGESNGSGNTGGNSGSASNGSGNSGNSGASNGNSGNSSGGNADNSGSASARLWHPSVSQAQAYGAAAAAQRGWTGADWDALLWLWNHESGWRWNAQNPSSTAYGIPQSLYAIFDTPGYRDDGAVQIDWGLNYIANRYGSPSKAKAFWLQKGWY